MNTITFRGFDAKEGSTIYELQKLDDIAAGCEIAFVRGIDDTTRQPRRYTAMLQPGAKSGSWKSGDTSGEIEHVTRTDDGTDHTIKGIWVEDGQREQIEVFFWK